MKRILPLIFAILLVPAIAMAQLPPRAYIGLYADGEHSQNCFDNPGGSYMFTMWIWCLSSDEGIMSGRFDLSYPSNIIEGDVDSNPALDPFVPCTTGVCFSFYSCQYNWVWLFKQQLIITDTSPSQIDIIAHPETGSCEYYTCEPGPAESFIYHTPLYLNQCPQPLAKDEKSWGAVKSLYR